MPTSGSFERKYMMRFKDEVRKLIASGYNVEEIRECSGEFSNSINVSTKGGEQLQVIVYIPHGWPNERPKLHNGIDYVDVDIYYDKETRIIDIVNRYFDNQLREERLNQEVKKLEESGYTVTFDNLDEDESDSLDEEYGFSFIHKISADNGTGIVDIYISPKWPSDSPKILEKDGLYDPPNYNEKIAIVDVVKGYFVFKSLPKILVFCHPERLGVDEEPCYATPAIKGYLQSIGKKEEDVVIKTVDIDKEGDSDFIANGFSTKFINAHKGEFDMVWVPDCDGPWYNMQTRGQFDEFIGLIDDISMLVKPGGLLFCWKFINFRIEDVAEKLKSQNKYANVEVKLIPGQPSGGMFNNPLEFALPQPFLVITKK